MLEKNDPHVALIEDNTDNFVSSTLARRLGNLVAAYNQPAVDAPGACPATPRSTWSRSIPTCPYIQYLLPGSIMMSIFMMVMIGGGIIFIDDKARGLHEGYLVTPDQEVRADRGVQPVGHDQGGARRRAC